MRWYPFVCWAFYMFRCCNATRAKRVVYHDPWHAFTFLWCAYSVRTLCILGHLYQDPLGQKILVRKQIMLEIKRINFDWIFGLKINMNLKSWINCSYLILQYIRFITEYLLDREFSCCLVTLCGSNAGTGLQIIRFTFSANHLCWIPFYFTYFKSTDLLFVINTFFNYDNRW